MREVEKEGRDGERDRGRSRERRQRWTGGYREERGIEREVER